MKRADNAQPWPRSRQTPHEPTIDEIRAAHGKGPLTTALRNAKGADVVVPLSIEIEEEISELPPEEQREFIEGLGLDVTALDIVVSAS